MNFVSFHRSTEANMIIVIYLVLLTVTFCCAEQRAAVREHLAGAPASTHHPGGESGQDGSAPGRVSWTRGRCETVGAAAPL